jgi:dihydropyrimidinase
MPDYDLVIAGGTVVTPADMFRADIGIAGGRVAALGLDLKGDRTIDADGLLVMPGGVDSHCHIEQLQEKGGADEETFVTGSSRAAGSWHPSPSTAAAPRRRWWTTPSTRSSPTPPTRWSSTRSPRSSHRASAA